MEQTGKNISGTPDSRFPLIKLMDGKISVQQFIVWYQDNKKVLEDQLLQTGALLFRGVDISDVDRFETVMDAISSKFMAYVDGNSPRTKLSSKVYTSTEYDPAQPITMHNELSYSYKWPAKIFFCCTIPAESGGETPIADCRKVLAAMNPDLVAEIERKKILYIRNLNGGPGLGPSWQDTFETTSRAEVEAFCKEAAVAFQWKADGGLKLLQPSEGIVRHPVTGEKVWFNQIDQFHPSHLNQEMYETLMLMYNNQEDELPMYVSFGDGTKITKAVVEEVTTVMKKTAVAEPWQKGDLLMLDNVLTCHGRAPFKGNRKVLVSMSN